MYTGYAEAITVAEKSVRAAEREFGAEDPNTAISLDNLAALYDNQGRYAEAEPNRSPYYWAAHVMVGG